MNLADWIKSKLPMCCADCIHCKPDQTGKLRYCAEEYMGFPNWPDAKDCPGFSRFKVVCNETEEDRKNGVMSVNIES